METNVKENRFRTKTGYCHVLEDRIELSREGIPGRLSQAAFSNNIYKPLIIYSIIAVILMSIAWKHWNHGDAFISVVYASASLTLVVAVIGSINNSATPVIYKADIIRVKFIEGIPGLTRSRFIVYFNENKKRKKRLITLPGTISNGSEEVPKALTLMKKAGFLES
jgi:hypothetical protein